MKVTKKAKQVKFIIELLKTVASIVTVVIIGIALGTLWIAADMKEHPSISGVNPEKSITEIMAEDVLSELHNITR